MSTQRSHVYFIESENGMVKIGVSDRPDRRVKDLLGSSPVKVRLVAVLDGSFAEERALHDRFDRLRSHGEWLFLRDELAKFVSSIRGVGVSRILDWTEIGWSTDLGFMERKIERQRQSALSYWADPAWREMRKRNKAELEAAKRLFRAPADSEAA